MKNLKEEIGGLNKFRSFKFEFCLFGMIRVDCDSLEVI